MPYFLTSHGPMGSIIYFVLLRASSMICGAFYSTDWVVWAILLWGFYVGARPDTKAVKTNGTWKFWRWQRDDDMYYRTHYGDIYAWYFRRWWQVWTLPYLLHVWIDRPFHNGVDRMKTWMFGEMLHLIVNLTFVVTILMLENAI